MTERELFFCAAALLLCLAAATFAWYTKYRMRKIMEHMNHMLDDAIAGNFSEKVYDESLLSSMESRLAHYLSSTKISEQNLTIEKEKIKELIADISHQTKTPIANILLYTQLLSEKELQEESVECVKALNQQAEKLNFFVGSLVKISRLEAGVFALHPVSAPISPLIKEVISQIAPKAEEKKISLNFEPQPLHACFDKKWTAEAVYNIVDNAVKYTPALGNISIDLLDTELFVRIGIKDSGIGISEEETAKIFGRFYRSPRVSDSDGIGIGLFLSREIIAREGGYIKVTSEMSKGSIFYVYLPAKPEKSLAIKPKLCYSGNTKQKATAHKGLTD